MHILEDIPFELDVNTVFQHMHLDPDGEYGDEVRAVAGQAAGTAKPRAVYEVAYIDERGDQSVSMKGATFSSAVLRANLEEVERVFPYIATCGPELDTVPLQSGDVFGQFTVETIKELALAAARRTLDAHVRETYALGKIATMNPGSGDAQVWPIEQQADLFSIFGDVESLVGVQLTDSFLMLPNKSVSGLFYPTEIDFVTCQLCHREECPGRRAAFDQELWDKRLSKS